MKRIVLLIMILAVTSVSSGNAVPEYEEYAVTVEIYFDDASDIYQYAYILSNPENNKNCLFNFTIYIPKLKSDKELSWNKLSYGKGYSRASSEAIKENVVPVGMNAPDGWTYGIGYDEGGKGFASFGILDESEIRPGNSSSRIVITSYGIPTIRDVMLRPFIDPDILPDEYYGDPDMYGKLRDRLIHRTKTIGPTAPPKVLVPVEFVNNIIKMKHEAAELGWITNAGIVRSLDQKLDSIKKKLQQNNKGTAKNILGAFINEVEAQGCESYADCPRGKHLKPEAYALLKYNARYLIDNLK